MVDTTVAATFRTTLGWSGRLACWVVIIAAAAALTVAVLVPRLAGATPYTVLTGSMTPRYPPGTLVVVRPAEPDDVAVGDVITYQLESGEPAVVTHRVASVAVNTVDGGYEYRTRGDANSTPDSEPVRPIQVRGELWYAVPYLGRLSLMLTGAEHHRLELAAAAVLGLYAVRAFTIAAHDRRRRRSPERTTSA